MNTTIRELIRELFNDIDSCLLTTPDGDNEGAVNDAKKTLDDVETALSEIETWNNEIVDYAERIRKETY